jgi:hypothetical protein
MQLNLMGSTSSLYRSPNVLSSISVETLSWCGQDSCKLFLCVLSLLRSIGNYPTGITQTTQLIWEQFGIKMGSYSSVVWLHSLLPWVLWSWPSQRREMFSWRNLTCKCMGSRHISWEKLVRNLYSWFCFPLFFAPWSIGLVIWIHKSLDIFLNFY